MQKKKGAYRLPSSISIIARSSFSASGSPEEASFVFVFAFDLYAALVRGAGFGTSSSSSSSEITTPLLTRAALLVSVRLDARVLEVADSSSSESEGFNIGLSFDLEGAALDDVARGGSSTGSALILRVSVGGLGAGAAEGFALALLKSSFPEGFAGFAGSSLICGLTSSGSDLATGFASPVIEGAFDRPGSLFLEVAAAEDFAFDEDRLCWKSVRFCSME